VVLCGAINGVVVLNCTTVDFNQHTTVVQIVFTFTTDSVMI
jgi:hypothetical protein